MKDCTFINFFDFWANAPESFEKTLAPVSGELKVKSGKTPAFNSKVNARQLCKLAVFTVQGDFGAVGIRPPHRFVGLHLPLGRSLVITENRRKTRFDNDIHLLRPERELFLEAPEGCRVLVANIYAEPLQEYAL